MWLTAAIKLSSAASFLASRGYIIPRAIHRGGKLKVSVCATELCRPGYVGELGLMLFA